MHRLFDHRDLAASWSLPLAARRPGQPNSPGQTQTSSKAVALVPNQRVRTLLAIPNASLPPAASLRAPPGGPCPPRSRSATHRRSLVLRVPSMQADSSRRDRSRAASRTWSSSARGSRTEGVRRAWSRCARSSRRMRRSLRCGSTAGGSRIDCGCEWAWTWTGRTMRS